MVELTRNEIKHVLKRKLDDAIRRADYERFKELLSLVEIAPGSERYRLLEAEYWRAVALRQQNVPRKSHE